MASARAGVGAMHTRDAAKRATATTAILREAHSWGVTEDILRRKFAVENETEKTRRKFQKVLREKSTPTAPCDDDAMRRSRCTSRVLPVEGLAAGRNRPRPLRGVSEAPR